MNEWKRKGTRWPIKNIKTENPIISQLWWGLGVWIKTRWENEHGDIFINTMLPLEYRLYGVIQDVIFTQQPHFSCSFLSLICLSTNQNIQLIHSLLIRIDWTTGNGILMSSSHWPIYNKFHPGTSLKFIESKVQQSITSILCKDDEWN